MKTNLQFLAALTLLFLTLGAQDVLAQSANGDSTGWRLKLSTVSMQSTRGGLPDPSFGVGLGLEYRASRSLGVEISAASADLESKLDLDFFGNSIDLGSSIRTTPILARLNWHLTPQKRADFYLGPVAGWVRYGDIEVTVDGFGDNVDSTTTRPFETDDSFAWGFHLGLDVPLGERPWFFTTGLTYLRAEVDDPVADEALFALDPIIAHAGIGFRF